MPPLLVSSPISPPTSWIVRRPVRDIECPCFICCMQRHDPCKLHMLKSKAERGNLLRRWICRTQQRVAGLLQPDQGEGEAMEEPHLRPARGQQGCPEAIQVSARLPWQPPMLKPTQCSSCLYRAMWDTPVL